MTLTTNRIKCKIEQIETGWLSWKILQFLGIEGEVKDQLDLCIGTNAWLFSLFTGYRQVGTFKVRGPHEFREGQEVIATIVNDRVVTVEPVPSKEVPPQ